MIQIKTLAEAEEMRKEAPYLYLIAFVTRDGKQGSTIMGFKEDAPLYKVYFIFNEVNNEHQLLIITNIVKIA